MIARFIGGFLGLFLLIQAPAMACPDNQYRDSFGICWPKGPSVRVPTPGEVLSAGERLIRDIARELGKTPDAIRQCAQNIHMCATEILSSPLALPLQAYMDDLYKQGAGRVRPLPSQFIAIVQQHYKVNLNGITYADRIDTKHGMTVAYCDRIFFAKAMSWRTREDIHHVLHELEHTVQCQGRGKGPYLAEYILKGAAEVIRRGHVNIHDMHDYERAADRKADALIDSVYAAWQQSQSAAVAPPPPITNGGMGAITNGGMGPIANACSTPQGACPMGVALQVGSPCNCSGIGGIAQQRPLGGTCATQMGVCPLASPLFQGDRCFCPSLGGPVWGMVN